ncbi:MAG: GNAT family N-acetyltransferase [Acetobacter sp.]|nr:GNAT family N-acetyltransferase [Acetobacter sp.]MCH4059887.1 GNAT family N-acetyltransferase [Acetobacter sp.]MCH4086828.1 GNAT family N-acetyltransferase [Acetobacter sp.]MCI1294352.1 GNAT family N-acetyltransferase [Acetobacter sp.]MCI1321002.1 GNAT family N-acetyltransferase [Acetobacter sp.]
MEQAIAAVRDFNRFYMRYVGALDSRFLGCDMTLTEARLLLEIANREPVQANVLQDVLTLDRGYLSRMIRRFENEGWIARERSSEDGRSRPMKLTAKGRIVFENVDQRQHDVIEATLLQLNETEQQTLAQALTSVRRLLTRTPASSPLDVLNRPVWHALTGRQSSLSVGNNHALCYQRTITPFGASAGTGDIDLQALGELLPPDGEIWLVEKEGFPIPPGLKIVKAAECLQMVASHISSDSKHDFAFFDLGADDAVEMRELAMLTVPGPFQADTWRLGGFIGIREAGRLVAMAGERMKPGNFTEVSGVCTHPHYRGRGYAGFLMRIVAQRILDRGETPFLHTYSDNKAAIALYQSLGFTPHQLVTATVLQKR